MPHATGGRVHATSRYDSALRWRLIKRKYFRYGSSLSINNAEDARTMARVYDYAAFVGWKCLPLRP